MEKVSWRDKKTNEQVLHDVDEKRSLLEEVLKRKKNWIGHVVRREGLLKQVMEGRMEGKRPRGRPRIGMIEKHTSEKVELDRSCCERGRVTEAGNGGENGG